MHAQSKCCHRIPVVHNKWLNLLWWAGTLFDNNRVSVDHLTITGPPIVLGPALSTNKFSKGADCTKAFACKMWIMTDAVKDCVSTTLKLASIKYKTTVVGIMSCCTACGWPNLMNWLLSNAKCCSQGLGKRNPVKLANPLTCLGVLMRHVFNIDWL